MLREHSPLGEGSLHGWSPVIQVLIQLLHNIFSLLVKSSLVKLETSRTLILPITVSVLCLIATQCSVKPKRDEWSRNLSSLTPTRRHLATEKEIISLKSKVCALERTLTAKKGLNKKFLRRTVFGRFLAPFRSFLAPFSAQRKCCHLDEAESRRQNSGSVPLWATYCRPTLTKMLPQRPQENEI